MILADKRDYSIGYRKHYAAYEKMNKDNADKNSRRLLLIYCVECGLKYRLLNKWGMDNPKALLQKTKEELDADDKRKREVLSSHNLEKILKELGQQGVFKFPALKTVHNEIVSAETYHQFYRYGIRTGESKESKERELENSLNNVLEWLREGV